MNLGLKGKNILITGATDGFGRALAIVLAREGANLMLHCTGRAGKREKLASLCEELTSAHGVRAKYACADLSNPTAAKMLFDDANARMRLDLLVNNAAI